MDEFFPIPDTAEDIEFAVKAASLTITCPYSDGVVTYKGGRGVFSAPENASDNRYLLLVEESTEFFGELNTQWTSGVQDTYSRSGSACGWNPAPGMERSLVSAIETDITNGSQTARNGYSTPNGGELRTASIIGPSTTFTYTSTDLFEGEEDLDIDTSDCDCDDDGCETWYDVDLTIKPQQSKVDWVLKDTKYRIPLENTWKQLVFKVKPYTHNYQQDS
jgi:hypothetical protein